MIPLGVLASAYVAAAGGDGELTYLGTVTSGGTVTIPSDGSLVLAFAWGNGSLRTLSGVTIGGAAATLDAGDAVGRRAGAAMYRAAVAGATADVSWTFSAGVDHTVAVYHYPGTLAVVGGAVANPTSADGLWSLSVTANVGDMLINSAAVAYGSSTATLGTGEDVTEVSNTMRRSHGHGLATASPHTVTATVSPAQTNSNYTRLCAVTYAPWDGNPEYLPNSIWGVSGNSLGAVSDPISSWSTFAQADTAKQPVVTQDGSFKYAAFDGSDYLPHSVGQGLNTSQTMFAVVRVPTAATRSVVGVSSGTGVHLGFTATLQAKMAAHGGDFASANTTATASTGQWCVISGRYTYGSSLESRLNAGTISAVSTTTNATPDRSNALGGNAGSAHSAMDIAEAWNFRRALSNAEWDGIVSHLMKKYGIGGA